MGRLSEQSYSYAFRTKGYPTKEEAAQTIGNFIDANHKTQPALDQAIQNSNGHLKEAIRLERYQSIRSTADLLNRRLGKRQRGV